MAQMLEFTDGPFFGPDDTTQPDRLPPGVVEDCTNVHVVGGRGGKGGAFKSRPGKVAQLSVILSKPIYKSYVFIRSDGSLCTLLAVGGEADGRIHVWEKDGSTTTVLTSLGTYNAPAVQFCRLGDWVFISGNLDGKLWRTNLDPTSPVYENCDGLSKPTRTITATLTNSTLAPFADVTDWASDVADTSTNLDAFGNLDITDYDFQASSTSGVTAGSDLSPGWTVMEGTVEADNPDASAPLDLWVRMDEPGSRIRTKTTALIDNGQKDNAGGVGDATRYCTHWAVSFPYLSSFAADSVIIRILACNGSGTELARDTKTYTSPSVGYSVGSLYFSVAGLVADTEASHVMVEIEGGSANQSGSNGPYLSAITVTPLSPEVNFTQAGEQVALSVAQSASLAAPTDYIAIGSQRLTLALGASTDFDTKSKIAIPFTLGVDLGTFPVRLAVRSGANAVAAQTATPHFLNDFTFESLPNGQGYLSADLSVLDTSERQDVWFLDLVFPSDLPMPSGGVYQGQVFFTLGPLIESGNLSVNSSPYRWRYREKREKFISAVSQGTIKSPASEGTGYLEPTLLQAQGQLVLSGAVPENTENTVGAVVETITLEFFRSGGERDDGFWRLVAEFNPDTNHPMADNNGLWSWDASTRTFVDNVPDIALLNADVLLDHTPAPTGALALGAHAGGRLAIGTAEGVHVSQIAYGLESGLYWNEVNSESAGDLALQGFFQPLSGNENANSGGVVAIVGADDRSVVLYKSLPYVLTGTNPNNFDLRPLRIRKDFGPISHRAVELQGGSAWFLGIDGLHALNVTGFGVTEGSLSLTAVVSGGIEKRLNPGSLWDGEPLDPAAYAQSSLFVAGDRVFLSAPAPGSTAIDRTYVFDSKNNRWYPWTLGAITGGFSFSGDGDANDVYVTSQTGQIFRLGPGYGDNAVRGGEASPVAIQLVGRRLCDPEYLHELQALYISLLVDCDEAPEVSITVRADPDRSNVAGREYQLTYTGDVGQTPISNIRIGSQVVGGEVQWVLSAETTDPLTIRWVRLDAIPGAYR